MIREGEEKLPINKLHKYPLYNFVVGGYKRWYFQQKLQLVFREVICFPNQNLAIRKIQFYTAV